MEVKQKNLVTLSAAAKVKIMEIRTKEGHNTEAGVRVSVLGGGCSGLSYKLDFESTEKPGDHVFEEDGVRIFVEPKSLLYLVGTELDFSDGLNGKGFYFNNPNASRTCACGESFAV